METHVMERTQEAAMFDDWETWSCPACGRRLFVTWKPKFRRITVVPGDETAIHDGGMPVTIAPNESE